MGTRGRKRDLEDSASVSTQLQQALVMQLQLFVVVGVVVMQALSEDEKFPPEDSANAEYCLYQSAIFPVTKL